MDGVGSPGGWLSINNPRCQDCHFSALFVGVRRCRITPHANLAFGPATILRERAPHKGEAESRGPDQPEELRALDRGTTGSEILLANSTRSRLRTLVPRCRGPSADGRNGDCSRRVRRRKLLPLQVGEAARPCHGDRGVINPRLLASTPPVVTSGCVRGYPIARSVAERVLSEGLCASMNLFACGTYPSAALPGRGLGRLSLRIRRFAVAVGNLFVAAGIVDKSTPTWSTRTWRCGPIRMRAPGSRITQRYNHVRQ